MVTKIRVVAVTLLDALPAADYGDANVQGIAAYLLGERIRTSSLVKLIPSRFPEHHDEHRKPIRRLRCDDEYLRGVSCHFSPALPAERAI